MNRSRGNHILPRALPGMPPESSSTVRDHPRCSMRTSSTALHRLEEVAGLGRRKIRRTNSKRAFKDRLKRDPRASVIAGVLSCESSPSIECRLRGVVISSACDSEGFPGGASTDALEEPSVGMGSGEASGGHSGGDGEGCLGFLVVCRTHRTSRSYRF